MGGRVSGPQLTVSFKAQLSGSTHPAVMDHDPREENTRIFSVPVTAVA